MKNVVIRTINYTNPIVNGVVKIGTETYTVKDIAAGGKKNTAKKNEIRFNSCNNMNVIKIGANVLPIIYEWINLIYRNVNFREAQNKGMWIIFKDIQIEEDDIVKYKNILNEKRSVNAALRLYNIIKYFLICREKIKEKNEQ